MKESIMGRVTGILFLMVMAGCQSYGEIKVRNDSFKNSKVASVKLDHKSEETFGMFNSQMPIEVTYTKEVKSGQPATIEMKIITPASATSELKPQAFIKADKQKFEVTLEGIQKTSATQSTTTNQKDVKGMITDTQTKTSTQFASMGTIKVPIEVWKQMMGAQKVGYRLYIDQEALSFLVSDEWLEKLKELDAQ
jgi:hypothetical protein